MLSGGEDHFKHAIYILEHVVVPEPQNAIAATGEKLRAPFVSGIAGVLAAVELDNQPALVTGEIAKAPADRCLSAKVMLLERRLTQVLPEDVLCIGCGVAEQTRTTDTLINFAPSRVRHRH